jgi:hypothetical protein
MLAVTLLMALMLFTWGVAIWASWSDDESSHRSGVDSDHFARL